MYSILDNFAVIIIKLNGLGYDFMLYFLCIYILNFIEREKKKTYINFIFHTYFIFLGRMLDSTFNFRISEYFIPPSLSITIDPTGIHWLHWLLV